MNVAIGFLAMLALIFGPDRASEVPTRNPVELERLCGELIYRTPGPDGGEAKPLRGVRLEIYAWREDFVCCNSPQVLWKATTGQDGSYKFRHVRAGQYWLVAYWQGETFQLPIQYTSREPAKGDCYLQGLEIDGEGIFKSWLRALM